jgi:hypothetical protein
MKKALKLTQGHFESSSSRTPEYLAWHRLFKREFTKYLNELGITEIEISSPNHFDMSGFFRRQDGTAFFFSISDIRWSKDTMLLRTAMEFKNYNQHGANYFVALNNGVDGFKPRFESLVKNLTHRMSPVFV